MELEQEIQFGLDTFEPDGLSNLVFLGGAGTVQTWFIPCRPTLRHWQANQYNLNFRGQGLINNGGDPTPTARMQIAVYRAIKHPFPLSTGGAVFAEQVPGTLYDNATFSGITVVTINTPAFDSDVFVLGGSYWIVIRVEDTTASGINVYQFAYSGWTVADSNIVQVLLEDVTSTGALPTTYTQTANIQSVQSNFPYLRADYV